MLKSAKLGHLDWGAPQVLEISFKNYRIFPGPRGKKNPASPAEERSTSSKYWQQGNSNTAILDHSPREEWDLAHFKTIWVPNHAKHCETLRNIAIIHWNWVPGAQIVGHMGMSQNNPNHITFNTIILDPILDLTTRFLLPEAGWGAVPLVGEACDQPGGSNRVVME